MNKLALITVSLCALACRADAQSGFSYNAVPLNKEIKITILGDDKSLLHCYNLYGYEYFDGNVLNEGEFIVPRNADTFAGKSEVEIKFCRVKEYFIWAKDTCRPMPIETGINLRFPDKKEPVYLNFDPSIPDAVFIPCK